MNKHTKFEMEKIVSDAFDLGWSQSGEGWNSEYPSDVRENDTWIEYKKDALEGLMAGFCMGEGDSIRRESAPDLLEALESAHAQMQMAAECVEVGRVDEALLHLQSLSSSRRTAIARAKGEHS